MELYLRRPATFATVFWVAACVNISPRAQITADARFEVLAGEEKAIIDRVAADFYESGLRRTQTDAIEARTSRSYAEASPEERAAFREDRRAAWRGMDDGERQAIRDAKAPRYDNLTDAQKAPFRRHAINRLGRAGAIDEEALAEAMLGDI